MSAYMTILPRANTARLTFHEAYKDPRPGVFLSRHRQCRRHPRILFSERRDLPAGNWFFHKAAEPSWLARSRRHRQKPTMPQIACRITSGRRLTPIRLPANQYLNNRPANARVQAVRHCRHHPVRHRNCPHYAQATGEVPFHPTPSLAEQSPFWLPDRAPILLPNSLVATKPVSDQRDLSVANWALLRENPSPSWLGGSPRFRYIWAICRCGAMASLGPIPRKAPTWPDTS